MILAIVGAEQAKFTERTERLARELIRSLITKRADGIVHAVVSGACHLGGVDIFAREEANALGIEVIEYPPREEDWERGYKPRNIAIARKCDRAVCITVRSLPPDFKGPRWPICYHCHTDQHVKSGGCWTVKYAMRLGKPGDILIVD